MTLTPEERAVELVAILTHAIPKLLEEGALPADAAKELAKPIASALRDAVEWERYECAEIADQKFGDPEIAEAIRSRSKKPVVTEENP